MKTSQESLSAAINKTMNDNTREVQYLLTKTGLSEEQCQQILDQVEQGNHSNLKQLLRRYRAGLMKDLHESEERVDSFDLLMYYLKKNNAEES
ncbi:MAG: hypothetical protein U0K57_01180 [Lachnospiraceae bacterium]|nr:hypothetical protein [Lachnospiraceae bacterium]